MDTNIKLMRYLGFKILNTIDETRNKRSSYQEELFLWVYLGHIGSPGEWVPRKVDIRDFPDFLLT